MAGEAFGIAPPEIYEVVLEMMRPVKNTGVLDVPGGSGGFAAAIIKDGGRCVAMDIAPDRQADKSQVQADMNAAFPFQDGSFDLITCIEGIEHIHDPFHLLQEFNRILKPGGSFILSTPNMQNFRSRVKFLLKGTFYWFDTYELTGVGHINVVPYFILHHIVQLAGFSSIEVHPSRYMSPRIPRLICKLMQKLISNKNRDQYQNSYLLLNAKNIIVSALKL